MERGLGEYYHSPVVKRKEESKGEKAVCYVCKEYFLNFALNASAKKGSTKPPLPPPKCLHTKSIPPLVEGINYKIANLT